MAAAAERAATERAREVVLREGVEVRSELSKLKRELAALERMEADLCAGNEVLSGQALAHKVQRTLAAQQGVAMAINTVPEFFEDHGRALGTSGRKPPSPQAAQPQAPPRGCPPAAPPRLFSSAVPPSSGAIPAPPRRQSAAGGGMDMEVTFDALVHELVSQGSWPRSICEIAARATGCSSLAAAQRWLREHPQQVEIARRAESGIMTRSQPATASPRAAVQATPANQESRPLHRPQPPCPTPPVARTEPAPPPRRPQRRWVHETVGSAPPRMETDASVAAVSGVATATGQSRGLTRESPQHTGVSVSAPARGVHVSTSPCAPVITAAAAGGPSSILTVRNLRGTQLKLRPLPADSPLSTVHQELITGGFDLGSAAAQAGNFLLSVPYPRRTLSIPDMAKETMRSLGLFPNGVLCMVPVER